MQSRNQQGFTLIELLVVIAIIGLLASVIIVAVANARADARDSKRLADMTQMGTALELYHNTNHGYPAATVAGVPDGISPTFLSQLPVAPQPPDGDCSGQANPGNGSVSANTFYYVPGGNAQTVNGLQVYSTYNYYFCTGGTVGDIPGGILTLTPSGIREY